jgi:hypothetical protein
MKEIHKLQDEMRALVERARQIGAWEGYKIATRLDKIVRGDNEENNKSEGTPQPEGVGVRAINYEVWEQ